MLQIGFCFEQRTFALRHFFATDRQKSMNMDLLGQGKTCRVEHAGPKERVEVGDVLPDEVMDLGIW